MPMESMATIILVAKEHLQREKAERKQQTEKLVKDLRDYSAGEVERVMNSKQLLKSLTKDGDMCTWVMSPHGEQTLGLAALTSAKHAVPDVRPAGLRKLEMQWALRHEGIRAPTAVPQCLAPLAPRCTATGCVCSMPVKQYYSRIKAFLSKVDGTTLRRGDVILVWRLFRVEARNTVHATTVDTGVITEQLYTHVAWSSERPFVVVLWPLLTNVEPPIDVKSIVFSPATSAGPHRSPSLLTLQEHMQSLNTDLACDLEVMELSHKCSAVPSHTTLMLISPAVPLKSRVWSGISAPPRKVPVTRQQSEAATHNLGHAVWGFQEEEPVCVDVEPDESDEEAALLQDLVEAAGLAKGPQTRNMGSSAKCPSGSPRRLDSLDSAHQLREVVRREDRAGDHQATEGHPQQRQRSSSSSSSSSKTSSSSTSSSTSREIPAVPEAPASQPLQREGQGREPRGRTSRDGLLVRETVAGAEQVYGIIKINVSLQNAYATCFLHEACVRTKTLKRARNAAHGRPFGMLAAWLRGQGAHNNKAAHMAWTPAIAERRSARTLLHSLPGHADFLREEAAKQPNSDSEPVDV
eukprot:6492784-Amphidinium_carterae.4